MRILFLNRDFPGPFRSLALRLGSAPGHTVLFLSERGHRSERLPGVRRLRVPVPAEPDFHDECERDMSRILRRAAGAANAMLRLRREGFAPDIVYAAAADGLGFHAPDIFPQALHVARADWFYTPGQTHTFFTHGVPRPPADFGPARVRNLSQYNALDACDLAVTDSQWQKAQYPDWLAGRIVVQHPGVDSVFFSPAPGARFAGEGCDLSGAPELITFSFRGAPPARGLPQFLDALPAVLAGRPQCHALIMAAAPSEEGASPVGDVRGWLQGALLPPRDARRVHALEFRSVDEYRLLLRASTVHIYLTAPFTLSAGLFEALACGALVIGSDTAPVREVLRHGENGFLCDFWDSARLAETALGALDRAPRLMPLREAARQTVLDGYDRARQTERHAALILDALEWKKAQNREDTTFPPPRGKAWYAPSS